MNKRHERKELLREKIRVHRTVIDARVRQLCDPAYLVEETVESVTHRHKQDWKTAAIEGAIALLPSLISHFIERRQNTGHNGGHRHTPTRKPRPRHKGSTPTEEEPAWMPRR